MAIDIMNQHAALARRDLRRDEMAQFGAEIDWVADPSLIPAFAKDSDRYGPYTNTAKWMLDQIGDWSWERHRGLDFAKVFDKYDLEGEDRLTVRQSIAEMAFHAYGPGILFTSSLVELVPVVATREGVAAKDWVELADETRQLGKQLSQNGTSSQAVLRTYWGNTPDSPTGTLLDGAKFKIGGSGLTSVTPIDELIAQATEVTDLYMAREEHSGVCVALQASPGVGSKKETMFDAVWSSYTDYAGREIFPHLEIDMSAIPPVQEADPESRMKIEALCVAQVAEWVAQGQI